MPLVFPRKGGGQVQVWASWLWLPFVIPIFALFILTSLEMSVNENRGRERGNGKKDCKPSPPQCLHLSVWLDLAVVGAAILASSIAICTQLPCRSCEARCTCDTTQLENKDATLSHKGTPFPTKPSLDACIVSMKGVHSHTLSVLLRSGVPSPHSHNDKCLNWPCEELCSEIWMVLVVGSREPA